jgi:hypothetical protein
MGASLNSARRGRRLKLGSPAYFFFGRRVE